MQKKRKSEGNIEGLLKLSYAALQLGISDRATLDVMPKDEVVVMPK
jgi:hypothetical protein